MCLKCALFCGFTSLSVANSHSSPNITQPLKYLWNSGLILILKFVIYRTRRCVRPCPRAWRTCTRVWAPWTGGWWRASSTPGPFRWWSWPGRSSGRSPFSHISVRNWVCNVPVPTYLIFFIIAGIFLNSGVFSSISLWSLSRFPQIQCCGSGSATDPHHCLEQICFFLIFPTTF